MFVPVKMLAQLFIFCLKYGTTDTKYSVYSF